ncbi:peptide deformylase [Fusibacter paucivorans]|uniref:Peptide deformylase n=1 Tax=Fusibacter paucivorans TaxID=76009 RepID=A0ABS5PWF8_9FIRM|nr:peptide deformylase [Fusibacter paucivorans]MBS7528662.1 peptide deformylase [Fusibacter paucivorans]
MAIREIRVEGDKVLTKKCKEVDVVDDHIRSLLDDMMETLHRTPNGAALAANQVGLLRRLVVIDYEGWYLKLVNPRIIAHDGEQECIEGCLSYPGRFGKTIRPQSVTVKALDENGKEIILTGEGEMAKCFCHEIEHLEGEVFLDKVIEFLT